MSTSSSSGQTETEAKERQRQAGEETHGHKWQSKKQIQLVEKIPQAVSDSNDYPVDHVATSKPLFPDMTDEDEKKLADEIFP